MLGSTIPAGIDIGRTPGQDESVELLELPLQLFRRLLKANLLGFRSRFANGAEVIIELLSRLRALLCSGTPRDTHAGLMRSFTGRRSGGHRTTNPSIWAGEAATQRQVYSARLRVSRELRWRGARLRRGRI